MSSMTFFSPLGVTMASFLKGISYWETLTDAFTDTSFQALHAIYSLENTLKFFVSRKANVEVVFWRSEWGCEFKDVLFYNNL